MNGEVCETSMPSVQAGMMKKLNGSLGISRGMAPLPQLFYKIMLCDTYKREAVMNRASPELLIDALAFVQDPELKHEMYDHLRKKVFMEGNRSQSFIINELTGMYKFVKSTIKYGMLTVKMHMDK